MSNLLPYYKRLNTISDTDSTGARMSSELENRSETILIYAIPYSVGDNDTIVERGGSERSYLPLSDFRKPFRSRKWPSFRYNAIIWTSTERS